MSKKVLIAESNSTLAGAIRDSLSANGYIVVGEVSKISDIEATAQETMPDLLVFDLNLSNSGIDGLSILKNLKQILPDLKILITGFVEAVVDYTKEILNAGFDGFWNKWDNKTTLLGTVSSIFN